MIERIEIFFRELISSLQIARLYTTKHAQFDKSVDKAFSGLADLLKEKEELIIGIVGEELAFEKEILFDLSKSMSPVIAYLKERKIEKIVFSRGVEKQELTRFIEFLALPKDEAKKDIAQYLSSMGVSHIDVGKIESTGSKTELARPLGLSKVYDDSARNIDQSLETLFVEEAVNYLNLRSSLKNIFEKLVGQYQQVLALVTIKRYDIGTFIHCLNVSVLAMHFSSRLGFSKEDCLDIGVAAVFHDIGKLYISRKIIKKPTKLSDEEFSQMKSHVVLGAEILLEHVDNLGILPVVVCLEHHLKYDQTGYPKMPFLKSPHMASKIVSICDVYDALSERRNYKNDYSPTMIYELMTKEKGKYFDPFLLDYYFKIMGVWPIGSIVSLNDNRVAAVKEENMDDIFSPKVEVIGAGESKEVIDLKETVGKIKITRYLNPWKEGKEYLAIFKSSLNQQG